MDKVEQLQPVLEQSGAPAPAPYFAEFVLESAEPRPGVDIAAYAGLAVYHLVTSDARTWLQTYWTTQDHYLRDGESFRKAIGAAPVAVHGYVRQLTSHRKPWWRRLKPYQILIGAAALFGAVQALGHYFDWAFMGPQLALKRETARLHLIQGAHFSETATLVNTLPVAHRGIELSAVLHASSGAESGINPLSPIAYLPENASQEVVLSGVAPEPGAYDLVLRASARAGIARFGQAFSFHRPVTVWPALPTALLEVRAREGGAFLAGQLAVGAAAPAGLACELQIERMPGIAFSQVLDFPQRTAAPLRWLTNDRPGAEMALLTWQVGPLRGQEVLPFRVPFSSSRDLDWSQLAERSRLRCIYLTRGDQP